MAWRFGPGPVFRVELVAAGRRWQTFALRAGLVAVLLAVLSIVWLQDYRRQQYISGQVMTHNDYVVLGATFAAAILSTQLALVLLAAPAATAGAICIDKARGNLVLMLATDLSAAEVTLGKLFARLVPVLSLLAASLPVLFITALLGGIGPDLLIGGFIVLFGAAASGCAIALLASLYVGKTHEALLITYLFIVFWLLSYPLYWMTMSGPDPRWLMMLNPFVLLFAPSNARSSVAVEDYAIYLIVTLSLALVCATWSALRLRRVVLHQASRGTRSKPSRRWRSSRLLDHNPMLWYERHRKRPSRATRVIWTIFITSAIVGTIWACVAMMKTSGWRDRDVGPIVNALQVSVGLLFVTIFAVTSMSDERTRGNLDVLLTTPLSTSAIILAKWRRAFAIVPRLLILPAIVAFLGWFMSPESLFGPKWESALVMRFGFLLFAILHPFACGAMLTSLGMALAVRMSTFGRAAGLAVALYVLLAVGWMFAVAMMSPQKTYMAMAFMQASPFFAQGAIISAMDSRFSDERGGALLAGAAMATALYTFAGILLYAYTARIFDKRMSRIPDKGLKRGRPPSLARFDDLPAGHPKHIGPAIVVGDAGEHEQQIR